MTIDDALALRAKIHELLRDPTKHHVVSFADPAWLAKIPPSLTRTVFIGCAPPVTLAPGESHTFTAEVFRPTRIDAVLVDGLGMGWGLTVTDSAPFRCAPFPFHPSDGTVWTCAVEDGNVVGPLPMALPVSVTIRNDTGALALIAVAFHGVEIMPHVLANVIPAP